MNSSSLFRGLIGLLLALSIAWKIIATPSTQDVFTDAIVEFLEHNQFDVSVNYTVLIGTPLIEAKRETCHLHIARLTPDGSTWNIIKYFSTANDGLFIFFGGRVYNQQPILWTALNHLWSNFISELGISSDSTPILAVWGDPSCDAKRLPWGQLREVPAKMS